MDTNDVRLTVPRQGKGFRRDSQPVHRHQGGSRQICLIGGIRSENRSGPVATAKQLKTAILARRASKGPRRKRTRSEPRQYTVADLERARDRVEAAERRIDNERTNNPNRGRAG